MPTVKPFAARGRSTINNFHDNPLDPIGIIRVLRGVKVSRGNDFALEVPPKNSRFSRSPCFRLFLLREKNRGSFNTENSIATLYRSPSITCNFTNANLFVAAIYKYISLSKESYIVTITVKGYFV